MVHANWGHNTLIQLTLLGRCQLQQIVNVHHFEASAVEEATLLADSTANASAGSLADDWIANLKTLWLACHTNDYTLEKVTTQVLERPGLFEHKLTQQERPLAAANVGSIPRPADDMSTSVVLKWRTPIAGKSHRGRTFIGPIDHDSSNLGLVQDPELSAVPAYGAAMITRYTGVGTSAARWPMTIYSKPFNTGSYQYVRRIGGTLTVISPPDYAGNSTFITAQAMDPILRVQRRRELGVGS